MVDNGSAEGPQPATLGELRHGSPASGDAKAKKKSRTAILGACAILTTAVVLAHGGSARGGFVAYDDQDYVTENPRVLEGISRASVSWAFRIDDRETYFHPLTWLSLMLDSELFGAEPRGFHAVNVALHVAVAVLLLLVLSSATGRLWPSLAAALLFAVHPLTVEGVAWVAERKTVLSSALGMGAILAYVAHARAPSRARLGLVAVLQAAALLAKPGLVVLPALLLVLDLWPLRRVALPGHPSAWPAFRRALVEKIPLAVVSAASLVLAFVSVRASIAAGSPPPALPVRLANALAVIPRYLAAAVWPSGLSVFHPYPAHVPFARILAGAVILVVPTVLAVVLARSRPWLLAGWLWFLVALLPYLGIEQAGLWPAWADRFAYVALMGLAVSIAFEGADIARRLRFHPAVPAGVTAAAAVALGAMTRVQVTYWKDSETLFRRAVDVEPASAVMQYDLGSELVKASRLEEALPHLLVGLEVQRNNPELRYVIGLALCSSSRFQEALPHLEEAVRLRPRYPKAHSQLATALRRLGVLDRAEAHYRTALEEDPRQVEATWNLADLLAGSGRLREALPLYDRFLEIAPPGRFELQRRRADMILRR